jgi:hypothetical protein
VTWDFALRINASASKPGTVGINYEPWAPGQRQVDLNPADDSAPILVNPAPGAPELPVTGQRVATTAGGGLAALAVGVVALTWGRRRRPV